MSSTAVDSDDREIDEQVVGLERLLGTKLAEFLDADYPYTMSQLSSTVRSHLYRGVDDTDPSADSAQDSEPSQQSLPTPKIAEDVDTLPTHPVKGGKQIADYLTFDW